MSTAKTSHFPDLVYLGDCAQSIQSIETSLSDSPITKEVQKVLFSKLKETSDFLGFLDPASYGVAELENKIVDLYGRISHLSIDLELAQLQNEAVILENLILTGNFQKISTQATLLKNRIVALCYECALSQAEKEIIREINISLRKANSLVFGEVPSKKKCFFFTHEDSVDIDIIAPFFDIAYAIYKERFKEAKAQYVQNLSQKERKEFQEHFKNISSHTDIDFEKHSLIAIQALLSTAYSLSHMEYEISDLSPEEIQLMFVELDEILGKNA